MATKSFNVQGWMTPSAFKPKHKAFFDTVEFRRDKEWGCDFAIGFLSKTENPFLLFDKEDIAFLCEFLEGVEYLRSIQKGLTKRDHVWVKTYQDLVIIFSETVTEDRISFYNWQECEAGVTINLYKGSLPEFIKALKAICEEEEVHGN